MKSPTRATKPKRRGLVYGAKIGLPILAILLIAVVVIWSRIRLNETRINVQELKLQTAQSGIPSSTENGAGLSGSNVLYDGVDDRGRAYHIAAANAIADGADQKDYRLVRPQGDINLNEEEWAALRSDKGYYWAGKKVVDFYGNVVLFRNDGTIFETEAASLDIRGGIFTGQMPVKGGNTKFEVQSERGFEVREDGKLILFIGPSRAIIFGKGTDQQGLPEQ